MFMRANSQGMRDRSMRSGTELAREIKLTDWSMAGNLSNRSSGVQIPRDICTRLTLYLHSAKCSWIIRDINHALQIWCKHTLNSMARICSYFTLLSYISRAFLILNSYCTRAY